MSKPHVIPPLGSHRRSPPVSIFRSSRADIPVPGYERELHSSHPDHAPNSNVSHTEAGLPNLALLTLRRASLCRSWRRRRASLCRRSDGREEHHFAQRCLTFGRNREESLRLSNRCVFPSGRTGVTLRIVSLPTLTETTTLTLTFLSHPGVSPFLSPGLRRCTPSVVREGAV